MRDTELPPLASYLRAGMVKAKYETMRDLAKELDLSTEWVRRYMIGDAVPTTLQLRALCGLLSLDYDKATELAEDARLQQARLESAIKDPDFRALVDVWYSDPGFAECGKFWREDPQFPFFIKLYGLLTADQRNGLFKYAIAFRMLQSKTAAA